MTDAVPTMLDRAHSAMMAQPEDDTLRLQYYRHLSDAALFLWLDAEPRDQVFQPRVFPLEDGPVVLAFDTEDRLAEASGQVVPYAVLPGRIVAQALAGQGVALGINLGVAETAYLVPPEALTWLAQTLRHAPESAAGYPERFGRPDAVPPALLATLEAKLARLDGLAASAVLASVSYAGGRRGHILAFLDATEGAREALARAAAEALVFSGLDMGQLDVTFLAATEASARAMLQSGLRLDMMSAPAVPTEPPLPQPGSNGPPRLR